MEDRVLPDGRAFRLPAGDYWHHKLAEWVSLERRCCPFLSFSLDSGLEAVWLTVTAEGEGRRFLQEHLL